MKIRLILILFIISGYVLPAVSNISGEKKVAIIRVEFQEDNSEGTTGNGLFLYDNEDYCSAMQVDPPPHDKDYFYSHLTAVSNYFFKISNGKFGIDMENSMIFPENANESYKLAHTMDHYQPFAQDSIHDKRLTELFLESLNKSFAQDELDLSSFDIIIVVHPGTGQDFELPFLDPTPEDIPSTFVDSEMIEEHLGVSSISIGNAEIIQGIILPETQNMLLFEDTRPIFETTSSPCDYQYSLTGTMALMIGFHEGLPPLWNTVTGKSMVGVFSLMDQGSNNLAGIVPSVPDAWTRTFAGWAETELVNESGYFDLKSLNGLSNILKIPINDNEYFLLENRVNWFKDTLGIVDYQNLEWEETGSYSSDLEILYNVSGNLPDENGVFTSIANYDMGLPGTGILIWHVNEEIILDGIDEYLINTDPKYPGLDLKEADGAQDIGFVNIHILTDPSSGYFGDMWFTGNSEYERANLDYEGKDPVFGPLTFPASHSFDGTRTGISFTVLDSPDTLAQVYVDYGNSLFGAPDSTLGIIFTGDIDNDAEDELIGLNDSLWYSELTPFNPQKIAFTGFSVDEVVLTGVSEENYVLGLIEHVGDSIKFYIYSNDGGVPVQRWMQNVFIDGISHIQGSKQYEGFEIFTDQGQFSVKRSGVDPITTIVSPDLLVNVEFENRTETYYVSNDRYSIYSDQYSRSFSEQIVQILASDLERDGIAEIIALDNSGVIHVLTNTLVNYSGFPLSQQATVPLLIADLKNEQLNVQQEIAFISSDGKLNVIDKKGRKISNLAIPDFVDLIGIAKNNNGLFIVTNSGVYQYSEQPNDNSQWVSKFGNSNASRSFEVKSQVSNDYLSSVFIKQQTYAYPNPSKNGQVTFRLAPGSAINADIVVYDIAGQKVWEVKSIILEPGNIKEIIWQTGNVEPGVYLARVTGNSENKNNDIILKIGIIQ